MGRLGIEIYYINIDCMGLPDVPFGVDYSGFSRSDNLNRILGGIMDDWDIPYTNEYVAGDHLSFSDKGIQTVNICQSGGVIWQFIHSPDDTKELLDFALIDKAGDLVAELIKRIGADFPEPGSGLTGVDEAWNNIDHRKIDEEINRRREKLELAFDEVYAFEMDDVMTVFASGLPVSYEEYKTFFPDVNIRREIGGFELKNVNLATFERPLHYMHTLRDWRFSPHILNEVRQVDLTQGQTDIVLLYTHKEDPLKLLSINVSSRMYWTGDWLNDSDIYTPIDEELVGSPHYWCMGMNEHYYDLIYFNGDVYIVISLTENWSP